MKDICLTPDGLRPRNCIDFVSDKALGGIATFIGVVRNHTQNKTVVRLEFEAYEPMAIAEMQKIADHILAQWSCKKVAIHHRVGILYPGEIAVVIAVAAPHRKDAFKACEYAIDTLKQRVPIWKKEIFEDGEVWVAAHP